MVELVLPADVPPLRDRLHAAGIDTFEADVRFATRYLIESGIKGGCEIEGQAMPGQGATLVFDNPVLRPGREGRAAGPVVRPGDHGRDDRLLAISLFAPGIDEVLVVDGSGREMPPGAVRCSDETVALDAFCQRVRRIDPDVLTGWNCIDFDLTVLQRVAARLGYPLALGREAGSLRVRKAKGWFGSGEADIPGRLVLDGIDLLRGAFIRMDDYSLDAVAREVLGEGKALTGDVRDRVAEIGHNYRHDLAAFVLYARTDARLAYQILQKLDLVRLALARSLLAGMTPDRVSASIASFDFLYLTELGRLGILAPTARTGRGRSCGAAGRPCARPVAGLHRDVWVFDFKSLYPSIIRTFNIDPLSFVAAPATDADLIRTPAGAFRREPAILPRLLDQLFPRREAAKRAGDAVAAHAIKILINSFYGVLGTPACRFLQPRARQLHHRQRPRDIIVVARLVRVGRLRRAVRRHRQPVRAVRRREPGKSAAAGAGAGRPAQCRAGDPHPCALARREPPGAAVRQAVPEAVPAAAAPRRAGRQQALRRPARWRGVRRRRIHGHGGRAQRLDRAREAGAARTVPAAVRRPGRRRVSRRRRARSGPGSWMRRSCIARTCARTRATTRQRRRRTWPPRASRRGSSAGWSAT